MLIYTKTSLDNLIIQQQVEEANQMGNLSAEELKAVVAAYPVDLYRPNIFMSVGLFILTCIIVSFSSGLFTLFVYDSRMANTPGFIAFLGLCAYMALELLVKSRKHYNSGVDNALIWISGGLLVTAWLWATEGADAANGTNYALGFSAFITALCLFYTLRFTGMLTAAIGYLAALAFLAVAWYKTGSFGAQTLPFALIILSFGAWFLCKKVMPNKKAKYHHNSLVLLQALSLVTMYAAGNYYVVQALGNELYGTSETSPAAIPFSLFFWIWTLGIPLVYIGLGLRKKDVVLLRTGLFLVAAAVFTFKAYYHVAPIEVTLTIAGFVFLALAVAVRKYLKSPRKGFTTADLNEGRLMDKINVESLFITETFSGTSNPGADKFGGGSFGGGGASSGY